MQFLAKRICNPGGDPHHVKKGIQLGQFLEQYILAIMALFSDLLNDTRGWHLSVEKVRALRGIEELLSMGKSYVRSALPQV